MTRETRDRWGYVAADENSRAVKSARLSPGILQNAQLIIQIPTETVDFLLNDIRGEDQDAMLIKILGAVDHIIAETIDEYADAYLDSQSSSGA